MPWRLIGFVIAFAIFLGFITLNIGNTSDISFGLYKIYDVPVFLTAFSSFFLGMFFAIPIVISAQKKRKGKDEMLETKPKKKWGKKKDDDESHSTPFHGGSNDNN